MRRSVRNALSLLAGETASRALGFLATVALARRIGIDAFGQIGFATAILTCAIVLSDLGLGTVGTREVARDRNQTAAVSGAVLMVRLVLAAFAFCLVGLLAVVLDKSPQVKWLLVLYAAGAIVQAITLDWVFVGHESMGHVAVARVISSAAYFGMVLLLVSSPTKILFVPVSFGLSTLIGTATLLASHVREHGMPVLTLAVGRLRGLIAEALPVGVASILTQVHANFGLAAMGLLRSDAETGIYNAAYRMVFFLLMLDRIFYSVFFPAVSRYVATRRESLPELTGSVLRLILALALPLGAALVVLSRRLLLAVFGSGYETASGDLRILAPFLLLSLLNTAASYTVLAAGRGGLFLRNVAVGTAFSVTASAVGVAVLGDRGASAGLVLGEALMLAVMLIDFLPIARPKLDVRSLSPFAATVIMLAVMVLTAKWNLPAIIALAAAGYVGSLILFRGLTLSDLGLTRTS